MMYSNKNRGFTLIELLVVIGIIGILSSAIMATLSQGRKSSRDTSRVAELRQVRIALDLYFDDNKIFPGVNNQWYDMECDGILNPDDGALYNNFSSIIGAPYMSQTPDPLTNVCMWYQPRNNGAGYRVVFVPELAKTRQLDIDCYSPSSWYCMGINW